MKVMKQVKLSRKVGLFLLLFYGLGNILGAGIYVLVGKVAGIAGYFSVFAFLLACMIALFTALSYMELASRYPVSAGAAVYIQEGIGFRALSVSFGLMIAVAVLVSAAAISHGFAGYLSQIVPIDNNLAMVLLILSLVMIAIIGIKISVVIASVLTAVEIFGLLLLIYHGFDKITHPAIRFSEYLPQWSFQDLSVVFLGAFLAFYAFLGFEDMVNIAEEVKAPSKTFPLAIILALGISTLLYVLIVIVALESLPLQELQDSQAPFTDIYTKLTGKDPLVISLIGAFAVVNGALIQIIMASRILYGMAAKGWLPVFLAQLSPRTLTPVNATILVGTVTILFALLFDLVDLAGYTSMLILIIFILVNISLIRIKRRVPSPKGVISIPMWVPWCGLALNLLLIGMQLFFDKG
jgi:amino acid transporter